MLYIIIFRKPILNDVHSYFTKCVQFNKMTIIITIAASNAEVESIPHCRSRSPPRLACHRPWSAVATISLYSCFISATYMSYGQHSDYVAAN